MSWHSFEIWAGDSVFDAKHSGRKTNRFFSFFYTTETMNNGEEQRRVLYEQPNIASFVRAQ